MAGNWKMYKTPQETITFFEKFLPLVTPGNGTDILICAPFVNLPVAVEAVKGSSVAIGAQNLFWEPQGAYTGEISGPMLKAAGCSAVIIGHSERRQYFGETDETVLKRTRSALAARLQPIVCVGERLENREQQQTEAVLETQFRDGIAPLSSEEFTQVVIAYEPVWAIGTGKVATPEQADEAHKYLRSLVRGRFGEAAATSVRILYGGSVKPDNIQGLMAKFDIDGALVGGASLEPNSFSLIVNF
jgi:triosephosphate isomerase